MYICTVVFGTDVAPAFFQIALLIRSVNMGDVTVLVDKY